MAFGGALQVQTHMDVEAALFITAKKQYNSFVQHMMKEYKQCDFSTHGTLFIHKGKDLYTVQHG